MAYSLLLGAVEYVGGVVSIALHDRTLWDYSEIPLNLQGHTDPFHAAVWGVLALSLTRVLQPAIHRAIERRSR
ncbi:MAG: hypothetical protein GY913_27625 [Proteobacteria bacterium]|nr:hypothetical protein [Pseudomonadota bacterium]MCP4920686.1 hypothetical protein [Pseudomonadota bacterium]